MKTEQKPQEQGINEDVSSQPIEKDRYAVYFRRALKLLQERAVDGKIKIEVYQSRDKVVDLLSDNYNNVQEIGNAYGIPIYAVDSEEDFTARANFEESTNAILGIIINKRLVNPSEVSNHLEHELIHIYDRSIQSEIPSQKNLNSIEISGSSEKQMCLSFFTEFNAYRSSIHDFTEGYKNEILQGRGNIFHTKFSDFIMTSFFYYNGNKSKNDQTGVLYEKCKEISGVYANVYIGIFNEPTGVL